MIIDFKNHKPAIVKLTKTMLDKAIIDANSSIREFSKLVGVDFNEMKSGDKAQICAEFLDGTKTLLSFYRTRNDRGDRRFSIKGIKSQAAVDDTIAITFKHKDNGDMVLVVNVTKNQEYKHLLEGK